ncbi:MAG: exonuclease SbcCD subunit D [Bacillota bacterium]|nr:exonuclease SbcCD subunit D [Bacillota bacterium]
MRIAHISDLHIGKRVNEYSMIEDQKYILAQILDELDRAKAEALLIAGDVYDKAVPSAEAVQLFDDFLVKLSQRDLPTFVISGNHDSPERIAFGGRLMREARIFMSPVYDGKVEPITLEDQFGEVNFYMLPFVKPAHINRYIEEEPVDNYTDGIKHVIDSMNLDRSKRNILVAHQLVTGADRTESEDISIGGTDNVDIDAFDGFAYVALGHIHRSQKCGRDNIRYSGTPLKYSFSEAKDRKSITIIDLGELSGDDCDLEISTVELTPLRDMVELRGSYNELMAKEYYTETSYQDDYTHIILTDEDDVTDAIGKLRFVYHNLMKLDYDNSRTRSLSRLESIDRAEKKSPLQLFSEFFAVQRGMKMNENQEEYMRAQIEKLWEEDNETE